jgi:hypothetical protein
MSANMRRFFRTSWITLVLLAGTAGAAAEQGRVHLADGTILRGEVELTATEAILTNLAGETRFDRDAVERIEWLEEPAAGETDYLRQFWALSPRDVAGHLDLARRLAEQKAFEQAADQCDYVLKLDPSSRAAAELRDQIAREEGSGASRPARAAEKTGESRGAAAAQTPPPGLPPPALLSGRDILRIKLSELNLDGAPERLNVRFSRVRNERELIEQIREDLKKADQYDPEWDAVLEKGRPYEQLPIVVKATGLKYIDRIDVRDSPKTFDTYRRRVLPMVLRGCARVGCHGGVGGQGFSLPAGAQVGDEFAYTTFVILDGIRTSAGPLIDRGDPAASVLPQYMLPPEAGRARHPPVAHGRVQPLLRSVQDERYQDIVNWIHSLRTPHPDYGLEYVYPEWYPRAAKN